jgi:glucose-1-phosphate thymidylyltransferase
MQYDILDGWWTDAGTFESLLRASTLVAQKVQQKAVDVSARSSESW